MSTASSPVAWELVRCSNERCSHEHARRAEGRRALPCLQCGGEMRILPLTVLDVPQAAAEFNVRAMLAAIGWQVRSELEKAVDPERSAERLRHTGRAEAFSEMQDMLEHLARARSGVIADQLVRSMFTPARQTAQASA